MKKTGLLAVLLAGALTLGMGVGCSTGDPEAIVSEQVDAYGWYEAFENTFHALCDGVYYNNGTARRGKFPEAPNCKVTYSDEREKLEGELVLAGDAAHLKVTGEGKDEEEYVQRGADGTLTVYARRQDGTWSASAMESEKWETYLFAIEPFNNIYTLLSAAYSWLQPSLGHMLQGIGTLDDTYWKETFKFDEARGGYLQQAQLASYFELVYKFTDGKLSAVIMTKDWKALYQGDEEDDGCKGVISFLYGGQKVKIPSAVTASAAE